MYDGGAVAAFGARQHGCGSQRAEIVPAESFSQWDHRVGGRPADPEHRRCRDKHGDRRPECSYASDPLHGPSVFTAEDSESEWILTAGTQLNRANFKGAQHYSNYA
jgi:hypothetical protein